MRISKHVSGLLISLWEPANSLFVRDKYVTPTGKRLHAGYVQKRKHIKNRFELNKMFRNYLVASTFKSRSFILHCHVFECGAKRNMAAWTPVGFRALNGWGYCGSCEWRLNQKQKRDRNRTNEYGEFIEKQTWPEGYHRRNFVWWWWRHAALFPLLNIFPRRVQPVGC